MSYHLYNTTMLAATEAAEHAEEAAQSGGISSLGFNPVQFLLQASTFIVLYILIRKFALKNITDTLRDRQQKINESLDNADQIERQLSQTNTETSKMLEQARAEATTVISKAHEEAGAIMEESELKAQAKAEKTILGAQAQIEGETARAKTELKSEMLVLVSEATEAVIGEKMTDAKDQEMIKKVLGGEA